MNFESYFRTAFQLADKGKCNKKGVPKNLLQMAVLMDENDVYLPKGVAFQRLLFKGLAKVGRLFGYRSDEIGKSKY